MREAAEAPDDLPVTFGVRDVRLAQRYGERDRALLIGEIFGVTERQIEEQPQRGREARSWPAAIAVSAIRRAGASVAGGHSGAEQEVHVGPGQERLARSRCPGAMPI